MFSTNWSANRSEGVFLPVTVAKTVVGSCAIYVTVTVTVSVRAARTFVIRVCVAMAVAGIIYLSEFQGWTFR